MQSYHFLGEKKLLPEVASTDSGKRDHWFSEFAATDSRNCCNSRYSIVVFWRWRRMTYSCCWHDVHPCMRHQAFYWPNLQSYSFTFNMNLLLISDEWLIENLIYSILQLNFWEIKWFYWVNLYNVSSIIWWMSRFLPLRDNY